MRRKRNKRLIVVLLVFIIALGGGGYVLTQFSDEEKDYSSEDSEASGEATKIFYSYDLPALFTTDKSFEEGLMVTCLQGIVNREDPRLYIYQYQDETAYHYSRFKELGYRGADDFWLDRLSEEGEWLDKYREEKVDTIEVLLSKFPEINKVVVWDKRIGATSNIATTIAGVENALPVEKDTQLYNLLINEKGYEVVTDLSTYNFKSNVAAYKWAREEYINKGKVTSLKVGYLQHYPIKDTANQMTGRDILVRERAYIFDLSPWENDGEDYSEFTKTFTSLSSRSREVPIQVIGYPMWWDKYSNYKGGSYTQTPVELEHHFVKLISKYGAGLVPIGNLGLNNISFHMNSPKIHGKVQQNPPPVKPKLENKTYILLIMGDYDDFSLYRQHFPYSWEEKHRKSDGNRLPVAWGVNPLFEDYVPDIISYMYKTKSVNDYFIGHCSGCLYMSPDKWPKEKFEEYGRFCSYYYGGLDYYHTGFILHGNNISSVMKKKSEYLDAFYAFSGNGINIYLEPSWNFGNNFVYHPNLSTLPMPVVKGFGTSDGDPWNEPSLQIIRRLEEDEFLGPKSQLGKTPKFLAIRKGPKATTSWYNELIESLKSKRSHYNFEVVDPYTFFSLAEEAMVGTNKSIYLAGLRIEDDVKEVYSSGEDVSIKLYIRNNGTDIWFSEEDSRADNKPHRIAMSIVRANEEHTWNSYNSFGRVHLPRSVQPGEEIEVELDFKMPKEDGNYSLEIDILREKVTGFREQGKAPLEFRFSVGNCQLDCDGKLCGSDGCGGSCGICTVNKSCVSGKCISVESVDVDFDGNGKLDGKDYGIILSDWADYYDNNKLNNRSDLNGNGKIDGPDYTLFLQGWSDYFDN